jgi:hypothetical protein
VERSGAHDVVTVMFWVPQVLAPLWSDHRIYAWADRELLVRLADRGVTRLTRIHGGLPDQHPGVVLRAVDAPLPDVIVYSLERSDEP